MPQLDIMSFTTQIFWAILAVFFVYAILVKRILPDILLIFRIRSKLLNRFQRKVFTLKNSTNSFNNKFDPASKLLEVALTKTSSVKDIDTLTTSLISSHVNQSNVDIIPFITSLDVEEEEIKVLPFLVFLAPTDEFILTISFFLFFIGFYYFFSPIITNLLFINQTKELTSLFARFADLRKQNLQLALTNAQTKEFLVSKSFTALNTYNALYTSFVLAVANKAKELHFNETLSQFINAHDILDTSKVQLQRLGFPDTIFLDEDEDGNYSKLRLISFFIKHVNLLEDDFDDMDEAFNLEELLMDFDNIDFDDEEDEETV